MRDRIPSCPTISPPVFAHRGDSSNAPENTLAAFRQAKASGANWIEFDVMLAACGEPVVIHDETLERTTSGTGRVSDYPYSQLRTLDAGGWFSGKFAGERIPTLSQVLSLCEASGMGANVEIKPAEGEEAPTVAKVLHVLSGYTPRLPMLVSSFSLEVLAEVRRLSRSLPMGLLLDTFREDWRELCHSLACCSVHLNSRILRPEWIPLFHTQELEVFAYTLNIPEEAEKMFSWGVDAVFSDCPAKIIVKTKDFPPSAS